MNIPLPPVKPLRSLPPQHNRMYRRDGTVHCLICNASWRKGGPEPDCLPS